MTLSTKALSITIKIRDTQHNITHYNGTQKRYNECHLCCVVNKPIMPSVVKTPIILSVSYAVCGYAECRGTYCNSMKNVKTEKVLKRQKIESIRTERGEAIDKK